MADFVKVKVDGEPVLALVTDVEEAEDGSVGVFVLPSRSHPSGGFRVVKADDVAAEDAGVEDVASVDVDPAPPSGNASTETDASEVGPGGTVIGS